MPLKTFYPFSQVMHGAEVEYINKDRLESPPAAFLSPVALVSVKFTMAYKLFFILSALLVGVTTVVATVGLLTINFTQTAVP